MLLTSVLLASALLHGGQKLQVTDLKVGSGDTAKNGDVLVMNYTGKLTSGKVFDSTDLHPGKEPFKFVLGLGVVVKGWDQGLVGMKVGGKRHLIIPPALGYGQRAMGADIPANSTLVFDVELKGIERLPHQTTKAGSGPAIKGGDTIQLHFILKDKGGKQIESTYEHEQPATMRVGQQGVPEVIWAAVFGMKQGEKRNCTIPAKYSFATPQNTKIPMNTDLVFNLEMVKVGQ